MRDGKIRDSIQEAGLRRVGGQLFVAGAERRWEIAGSCEMGCGRVAGVNGFCAECVSTLEEASLESLWNFETHKRVSDPRRDSEPLIWIGVTIGFGCFAYCVWNLALWLTAGVS